MSSSLAMELPIFRVSSQVHFVHEQHENVVHRIAEGETFSLGFAGTLSRRIVHCSAGHS